jgi:CheY-like chemotaxis protein
MTDPQPERAAKSQADTGQLLTLGFAHDINELLYTILGRAQLLLEQDLDPDARRHLALIVTATKDAAAMVKQILDGYPGSQTGPAPVVALADVVADCLELTRGRWDSVVNQTDFQYQIEVDLPADLRIQAHPAELREVVTNLLVNAFAAMPGGGKLSVTGRRETDTIHLTIEDNGCGMDARTKARLFEPGFSRGKSNGRGIGLSHCHNIIRDLGGHIEVASEPGSGSIFTIRLPVSEDMESMAPTDPQNDCGAEFRVATTPQRILVVDNEANVRELLQEILTGDGHAVTLAGDGQEALGKFRPGDYDLVLVDLTMPGLSGMEVAQQVRNQDSAVVIGLISGWGSEILRTAPRGEVVDFRTSKPVDLPRVRELVAAAAMTVARRRGETSRGT